MAHIRVANAKTVVEVHLARDIPQVGDEGNTTSMKEIDDGVLLIVNDKKQVLIPWSNITCIINTPVEK